MDVAGTYVSVRQHPSTTQHLSRGDLVSFWFIKLHRLASLDLHHLHPKMYTEKAVLPSPGELLTAQRLIRFSFV
ncbi:hypothetical protein HPB47_022755 [Ixodes persulcatus]|uniref:Uncharacterized protein n=1 Tax=Ixodes persulcatus TaxID=34615 RepID=A0AC60QB77_IXOPE|nr:hypothetical protein HPB47_022755 [Ixodes persulcatus]